MTVFEGLSEADQRTREGLERLLQDGEEVHVILRNRANLYEWAPESLEKVTRKLSQSQRTAVTSERVIVYEAGRGKSWEDFELDSISHVEYEFDTESLMKKVAARVRLTGSGILKEIDVYDAGDGEQLADAIRNGIESAPNETGEGGTGQNQSSSR